MPASPRSRAFLCLVSPSFISPLQFRFASADKVRQNGEGFGLLPRKSESNDALCPMCRGNEQPRGKLTTPSLKCPTGAAVSDQATPRRVAALLSRLAERGPATWPPVQFQCEDPKFQRDFAGISGLSEPPVGIEPTTYSLRVNRSAD